MQSAIISTSSHVITYVKETCPAHQFKLRMEKLAQISFRKNAYIWEAILVSVLVLRKTVNSFWLCADAFILQAKDHHVKWPLVRGLRQKNYFTKYLSQKSCFFLDQLLFLIPAFRTSILAYLTRSVIGLPRRDMLCITEI